MRQIASCLALLLLSPALPGCTALAAGVTADVNRQHRADATLTARGLAERPPAPGDTLTVRLTTGETLRDAFAAITPDSLVLARRTVALGQVERAVRPWTRRSVGAAALLGLAADAASVWYLLGHLWDGPGGGGWF